MIHRNFIPPIILGVITGIYAVLFNYSIEIITEFILVNITGYINPLPAGEGTYTLTKPFIEHPYFLPLITMAGGLISGILVYFLSRESEGIGTDHAIKAYHFNNAKIDPKAPFVKLISSAILIGSGGTSGREGPIALIGAGMGSLLSDILRLSKRERRKLVAIGLGAGVAAIFRAPLAGAIISAEVFYKKDFDIELLVPGFLASVTSYIVFGSFMGFDPLFNIPTSDKASLSVDHLIYYALLGFICGFTIRFFIKMFTEIQSTFAKSNIPPFIRPAIAGFITGTIGIINPFVIGNGYGWLQIIIDGHTDFVGLITIILSPLFLMFCASLILGSGGSGGIFGPSIMIGGTLGAISSLIVNMISGEDYLSIASFTVVGMTAFFGGAAKAPLSTLILVAEMTHGYNLLVPSIIAVSIAYIVSGDKSIFPSQVNTREDSPIMREEIGISILENYKAKEVMNKPITLPPEATVKEAEEVMKNKLISGIPVAKEGDLQGIVTKSDISRIREEEKGKVKIQDIMTKDPIFVHPDTKLSDVLNIMINRGIGRMPIVVTEGDKKIIVGIVTRSDIGKLIRHRLSFVSEKSPEHS